MFRLVSLPGDDAIYAYMPEIYWRTILNDTALAKSELAVAENFVSRLIPFIKGEKHSFAKWVIGNVNEPRFNYSVFDGEWGPANDPLIKPAAEKFLATVMAGEE